MIEESNELLDEKMKQSTKYTKIKFKRMRTNLDRNSFNNNQGFEVFESIISHRRKEVDFSHKRSYKEEGNSMFNELEYLVVCKLILVDEIYSLL